MRRPAVDSATRGVCVRPTDVRYGQKQTFRIARAMSALLPKADIHLPDLALAASVSAMYL